MLQRYSKLFKERFFNIHIQFVKKVLSKVKNKIIAKNYGNIEIEDILNNSFSLYGIRFENGFDSEHTNYQYGQVQIIKGSIDEVGVIYIYYYYFLSNI